MTEGMRTAGRSNERSAATTIGTQIMEQIRASLNPVETVGIVPVTRTALPLGAPYDGVVNPTPYSFDVGVALTQNTDLGLITVTVDVFRQTEDFPLVTLTTLLDDQ
jgi:hypothetical protein